MIVLTLIALGFAPGLLLLWFFYRKDVLEPEPKWFVLKMFIFGGLAALPAGLVELPLMAFPLLTMIAVAPLAEEAIKFAVVRWTIYRHAEFDEPMDGIVYAAAVALGFASVENTLFIVGSYAAPGELSEGLADLPIAYSVGTTVVLRAMLSVPGHALWSCVWGFALGRAKFMDDPRAARTLVLGALAAAVVLHALHNLLAVASPVFGVLGLAVLSFVLWRGLGSNVAAALRASPHREEPQREAAHLVPAPVPPLASLPADAPGAPE